MTGCKETARGASSATMSRLGEGAEADGGDGGMGQPRGQEERTGGMAGSERMV